MSKGINWNNVEFKGDKRFLSNMYEAPIKMDKTLLDYYPMFSFDDKIYPSSENLYQCLKSNDLQHRESFSTCSPRDSKILGRKGHVRSDWEDVKIYAMQLALQCKFTQHSELKEKLLATDDEHLEERNDWYDKFWGTYLGEGENHLGKLLMKLRKGLRDS